MNCTKQSDAGLSGLSLRQLANMHLTWRGEVKQYAIAKFGREHWRDALANELYALENAAQQPHAVDLASASLRPNH